MGRYRVQAGGVFAAVLALATASGASAQTAAPPPALPATPGLTDVLPDVTIVGRPANEVDVMANRISRFVNTRCFQATIYNRDPTEKFNRAYYAELTGNPDYYDSIKSVVPVKRLRVLNRPVLHTDVFRNLGYNPRFDGALAGAVVDDSIMAARDREEKERDPGDCAGAVRAAAETNTTFARGLALYDKGDYAAALPMLKKARSQLGGMGLGAEASLMIGKMYLAGQGTPKNTNQALSWFEKTMRAAETVRDRGGVRPARYDPQDPGRFFTVQAEAAVLSAAIYASADGVRADPVMARMWFMAAAHYGHVPAVKVLGDMYHDGYGGARSYKEALAQYNAAGGMRHAGARYEAGGMYERGEGVKADLLTALRYYASAARFGDAFAAYTVAVAYDTGTGVPVDQKMALVFYKHAALLGSAEAQTALGTYFYEGGGVLEKDHVQARAWFTEAALRGDPDAMVNLAAMLIKGEGGGVDLVKAWAWLVVARDGGRDDLGPGIASLERRMSAAEMATARALIAG